MNVVYVNSNDKVIGGGSMRNAVASGIIVRIARVFLKNKNGELLLQKRSHRISLPNKWDQTAAGYVEVDEEYEAAAIRELFEEMGIKETKLRELATYYSEENDEQKVKKRFNKIFIGSYDGVVAIDNDEVSDYKWVSLEELGTQMSSDPKSFTQGFIEAFRVYREKI